ncbi:MAG: hypothetical protein E2P02_02155 [Acidobacteria bacterium]|nr:MAG: hypothetical protein E2P02_02155 [Acidobacteriota bacterium]
MKLRTATLTIALGSCIAGASVVGAEGIALRVGTLIDGLGGPPVSPAVILTKASTLSQSARTLRSPPARK